MVRELDVLTEWIPEQMRAGTLYILDNMDKEADSEDPYWAVLACPDCGTLGLITRRQIAGLIPVICGSDACPASYFLKDSDIIPRQPF